MHNAAARFVGISIWAAILFTPLHGLAADNKQAKSPPVLVATYVSQLPGIDGKPDRIWSSVMPLLVVTREAFGGATPTLVVLSALYSDDGVAILAEWPDSTRSDMRDPYIWNANTREYDRPSKADDQFAVEFAIDGDFQPNMLPASGEYTADVWHWKAGRSNPKGWADDKRHLIRQQEIPGAKEYALGGHAKVFIARPMDEGTPAYKLRQVPADFDGEVVNSFEYQQASGSVADIRAKGVHNGSAWTLEMTRAFDTGHDDDAIIHTDVDNPFAIAVLNDELYWHHSVSELLLLRFAPH